MAERDSRACLLAATPMPPSVRARLADQLTERRHYGLRPASRLAWRLLAVTAGLVTALIGLRLRALVAGGLPFGIDPNLGQLPWMVLATQILVLFVSLRVLRRDVSRIGRAGPVLAAANVLLLALACGVSVMGEAYQFDWPHGLSWLLGAAICSALGTLLVLTLPFRVGERLARSEAALLDLQQQVDALQARLDSSPGEAAPDGR